MMAEREHPCVVIPNCGVRAITVAALCILLLLGAGVAPGGLDELSIAGGGGLDVILHQDFESGWSGWYNDNAVWDVGTPTSGPGAAHDGSKCAATVLGGNYPYVSDSRLVSPSTPLPVVAEDEEIMLRFWQWFSYASADTGSVQIQAHNGTAWGSWTELAVRADEISGGWSLTAVDLTAYAGQRVRIGFYHQDETEIDGWGYNVHAESLGWYIDEVEIVRQLLPSLRGLESFESGWNGWWASNSVWQVGEPNSGPGTAHDGTCVAGTVLNGNYPYVTDSMLISPSVQLQAVSPGEEIMLFFWQWFSYAPSDTGSVGIWVRDGTTWGPWTELAVRADEVSGGWSLAAVDLTAYAGQRVRIGFYHRDETEIDGWGYNVHAESSGWYIDEVEIVRQPVPSFCGLTNFESGWNGWYASNGVWQVGEPNSGPATAHDGTCVAGTVLNGKYPYVTDSALVSPAMQLQAASPGEEIMLFFWQWFSYASSDTGSVGIWVHDGTTWGPWTELAVRADEQSGGWSLTAVDLTAYAGQRVRIGFYHRDETEIDGWGYNVHAESSGWYIDEVEIVPPPLCATTVAISSTDGGSVAVPGEGEFPCAYGEVVCLQVQVEDGYRFVRWEGTAVNAGRIEPNAADPNACVAVDGTYTLKAIFEPVRIVIHDSPLDEPPEWEWNRQWAFGTPKGKGGSEHGCPDPTSGFTGQNVLGVNLDGDQEFTIGPVGSLVAGPFDLSNFKDVTLRFARWLNTDEAEYVKVGIDISADGINWRPEPVWAHTAREPITDCEWKIVEYPLGSWADGQSVVYLHWRYQVLKERAYAYSGWNIDDLQLIGKRK